MMKSFKIGWRHVLATVFWIGCLIGFIIQSKEVCEMYFKYQTRASTTLTLETEIPTPSLSICHTYPLIINRTDYKMYGINKEPPAISAKWDEWRGGVLTVKQIFHLTRHPNDTIYSCGYRGAGMWTIDTISNDSRTACLHNVKIKKYYMQQFMCYMYSFINIQSLSVLKIHHAPNYVNVAFMIGLEDIPPSLIFYIFAHPGYELPLMSRNFGKQIERAIDKEGYTKPNTILASFRQNKLDRLPPPYDTFCSSDIKLERDSCFRLCTIEKMKKINRFPATEMTFDPIDLKHVCINDLSNQTFREVIDDAYQSCKVECSRLRCHNNFMTTNIHTYFDGDVKDVLWIRLLIPDLPSVTISYQAYLTFLDFFVYLCSSFGMWFGLSVASFNPINLGKKDKAPKVSPSKETGTRRSKSTMAARVDLLVTKVSDLKRQVDGLRAVERF